MKNLFRAILVCLLFSMFYSNSLSAKETEFDLYYQRLEKVEQINNPDPKGWWETTKAFAKNIWNKGNLYIEKGVIRNLFPGEGSKTWYSEDNSNIAYKLKRVKVRDEAHLLELMGVSNKDTSKLSDGQRALLAVFQHSKSQAIKDRMKYSKKSKLTIMLSDLTGFEDEKKFPGITRDFWPYAGPCIIQMNSKNYNYPGSADGAKSTLVHEFSHTLDSTWKEFYRPYGKDGSHFYNERTNKRVAFFEGFAEFNQMLDFPKEVEMVRDAVRSIMVESGKITGSYTERLANGPETSGSDLTKVEGINALILYRLATEIPGGKEKVFKAFSNSSYPWRDLSNLLKSFVKNNSEDTAIVGKILDDETYKKLSAAEIKHFLGSTPTVQAFLSARGGDSEKIPSSNISQSTTLKPVKVSNTTGNPFSSE